ncbi:hypothetical protein CRUP_009928 [Coryphaenoides rupestris]|nr:hypothetical protein CRUP_009928 [Coryphaenoides rupestris]
MPLSDEGPYLSNGWGQVVRLRHLYAARHGLHLLISGDGRVHGSAGQTPHKQILPDGYNIYISEKHNTLVSLGGHRQSQQSRDRNNAAHAQFLPMISALDLGTVGGLEPRNQPEQDSLDNMEPFGALSLAIHSPSFQRR